MLKLYIGQELGAVMSKLNELIKEYCPSGVCYKKLFEVSSIIRGERITKKDLTPLGQYPVMSGGVEPMGHYDKTNRQAYTITVSSYGAAGFINYVCEDFWANDVCLSVYPIEKIVVKKYL